MQPKATAHQGTGTQYGGDGVIITIEADPLPLGLRPACLALIIGRATGIRSAIVEQWRAINQQVTERRNEHLAEEARQARANVERVTWMDEGNGRGL